MFCLVTKKFLQLISDCGFYVFLKINHIAVVSTTSFDGFRIIGRESSISVKTDSFEL